MAIDPSRILVVEDEQDIRQLMCLHLKRKGCEVHTAVNGSEAHEILKQNSFDLIILDWMLPGMSGLELLSWIRNQPLPLKITPILFVTAKSEPENIVKALQTGADDYLVKPFDLRVLMARVSSLLRRHEIQHLEKSNAPSQLTIGNLTLDREAHKVFLQNQEISLTLSEFLLLETLLKNQGKVLSRQQLASHIQGEETNVTSRTIDTHTSILRKKIGDYGKLIETVRGVGYRIGYLK